jgi:hypothetical protein
VKAGVLGENGVKFDDGTGQARTFWSWRPGQTELMPSPPIGRPSDHLVVVLPGLANQLHVSVMKAPALAKDPCGAKGFDSWSGLVHWAKGMPKASTQRNHRYAGLWSHELPQATS